MFPDNYVTNTIRNLEEIDDLLNEVISSFSVGSDMKVPFLTFVKLASADLKKQINDVIFDKCQILLDQNNDVRNDHLLLRKFFQFIISLDKKEILDSLETFYTADKSQTGYIIFIEEMIKLNKDVSGLIRTFLSLLKINGINYQIVDKFLSSISKDRFFLIAELVKEQLNDELVYYLSNLFQLEKELKFLDDMCRAVKQQKNNFVDNNKYFEAVSNLISFDKKACSIIFDNEDELDEFESWFFRTHPIPMFRNNDLSINYANFISNERFLKFEKNLVNKTNQAYNLVLFAKQVNNSSKRLILKKLVELKSEIYLIDFIKHFPEYKHLLMLL